MSRRGRLALIVVAVVLILGAGTTLSYYVDALWFSSLGYSEVFWRTLNFQAYAFLGFALLTFLALYGAFLLFKPESLSASSNTIIINGQPVQLPMEPALRIIALVAASGIALITGSGMMAEWPTLALAWYGGPGGAPDPIFGRPLNFYLFTLPALDLISGWVLTLAVLACIIAVVFTVISGGSRLVSRLKGGTGRILQLRGISCAAGVLLLAVAARVWLSRFDQLVDDQTIFTGVGYTDAHVTLTGLTFVAGALVLGAVIAFVNAVSAPRFLWLAAAAAPAVVVYIVVSVAGWYVQSFVVKP